MMERTGNRPLTAIRIDPGTCCVDLIQVEADEVAGVLRSTVTGTIDFEEGNCLVFDDGSAKAEHPVRFHFQGDRSSRPFFGPVLILGSVNGNWASTDVDVEEIRGRVTWELWDKQLLCYTERVLETTLAFNRD